MSRYSLPARENADSSSESALVFIAWRRINLLAKSSGTSTFAAASTFALKLRISSTYCFFAGSSAIARLISAAENAPEENKSDLAKIKKIASASKTPVLGITGTGGASGSGTNFIIRSKSSITGNNQPLFIVDGVPFDGSTNNQTGFGGGNSVTSSRFLDLDPNNIESVSILKGLSAAVLYGQQGRNGVVLITTKNGSSKNLNKKFEVTLSQQVYTTEISNLPDYQNTYGQGSDNTPNPGFVGNWGARFDAGLNIDHPYRPQSDIFPQFDKEIPYVAAENNVADFFRTGIGSATSVNISGAPGDGGSRYNMNFGYTTIERLAFAYSVS